jgi:FAD synthetase
LSFLSGVPSILENVFPLLENELFNSEPGANPTFHHREIYLISRETDVTAILNDINATFGPRGLSLGSYPEFTQSYYKVKLTLESVDAALLEEAYSSLRHKLPHEYVIDYDPDPFVNMGEKLKKFAEKGSNATFGARLNHAVKVTEECLKRYSAEEICVAFNGGKDCTVLLHLFAAMLRNNHPDCKIKTLYIKKGNQFTEAEDFIAKMAKVHQLELITMTGNIKDRYSLSKWWMNYSVT